MVPTYGERSRKNARNSRALDTVLAENIIITHQILFEKFERPWSFSVRHIWFNSTVALHDRKATVQGVLKSRFRMNDDGHRIRSFPR